MNEVSPAMQALYRGERHQGEALLPPEPDIFEAAGFVLTDRLREILSTEPSAVHARAPDDFTPLHLAAFFGHPDGVRVLLEAGADTEAETTNSFVRAVRPLHSAAANRDVECCRLLLDAGADVNAMQADGFTPLMEAAQAGDLTLARLLLDAGADPKTRSADGTTAETLARDGGHQHVLDLLAERSN
jgi:ankyrin repeat protein